MKRRDHWKGLLAAPAQVYSERSKGLPPLTFKHVRVITTSAGRNARWVFLKVIASEP